MKSLRLVYICEAPVDVRTIDALSESYKVIVLTRKNLQRGFIGWKPKKSENLSVELLPSNRLLMPCSAFLWLCRKAKQYDSVLVLGAALGAFGAVTAKLLTHKPTLLHIGKLSEEYFLCRCKGGRLSKLCYLAGSYMFKLLRIINTKLCDVNIAVGGYLANRISKHTSNVYNIPIYGVDTALYRPVTPEEKIKIRSHLDLPIESFLIFLSCRISPEKDVLSLIKAVKTLSDKGQKVTLMNLSGGYKDFEDMAIRNHIQDRYIARPAVDPRKDLHFYYQASDVCVQPSNAEGHGKSPLEALSCEIPVIASAVGGLTYAIKEGETGLVVPPGDPIKLAQAIEFAITNVDKMTQMAKQGREMVRREHEMKALFLKFDKVVEDLIATKQKDR